MEAFRSLGRALAALRSIRGLGLRDAAEATGLTVEVVQTAEEGLAPRSACEKLASLYGVDIDDLMVGMVSSAEARGAPTVFLLHGPRQDFDATDLGVLERALWAGRVLATQVPAGRAGVRRRLGFLPLPPAGPLARDAAIQGHKLARRLRTALRVEKEPLVDLWELLEGRMGVAVTVDALASLDLRAASILDGERVSAAAVLASDDESRQRNPALAHVYLAHELCHLVFDPGAPGSVQIALDDRPQAEGGHRTASLLESRAKGFAAELLVPLAGVVQQLGMPRVEASIAAARQMVRDVAGRFGTPLEIATWHIKNLGYIVEETAVEVLADRGAIPGLQDAPRLPAPCLRVEEDAAALAACQVRTDALEAPEVVQHARRIALEESEALLREVLDAARDEVARHQPIAATDRLAERLDALLLASDFRQAGALLARMDTTVFPPPVLTGVLAVAAAAKDLLGQSWVTFFARVLASLEQTWKLPPERREQIAARFR